MSENNTKQNISKKDLPAPIKKHRYYTPDEIKEHNTANDCYVSIFYEVYDLTKYIQQKSPKPVCFKEHLFYHIFAQTVYTQTSPLRFPTRNGIIISIFPGGKILIIKSVN